MPLLALSQRSSMMQKASHVGWTDVGVEERKKRRSRAYDVPLACIALTVYLGSYCAAASSGLSVPQSSYR